MQMVFQCQVKLPKVVTNLHRSVPAVLQSDAHLADRTNTIQGSQIQ
jgi:hypothetical protein